MNQELISFLKSAIECSVLIDPLSPGLTYQELREIGSRARYQDGEINDALRHVGVAFLGSRRLVPSPSDLQSWIFFFPEDPDYRDFEAFDFVVAELNSLVKSEGAARALIERSVLVQRAFANGIPRNDTQAAITWQVMAGQLVEKDQIIRFANQQGVRGLPSEQLSIHRHRYRKPDRERAYPIVKDVIARRTDGRAAHVEPLDAFADRLEHLGYGQFRLWWTQTVAELRIVDPNSAAVSASVLAAALVEGALTFIVKHARKSGHFQSSEYEKEPQTWRIDRLVASAASGGSSAILDQQTRARADVLVRNRQRIHAGRMLSDHPTGPPDIRPDEARDAKATADRVVRAILDWLQSQS